MNYVSRCGDGDLDEMVLDPPSETIDLDTAIEQATQARLFFFTGIEAIAEEELS